MDLRLSVVGLLVGLLIGVSGVGGSSVVTPLMILFLGIKPLVAIGTDLLYSTPTKVLGALTHRRQGTIDGIVVLFLSLGGIPAAALGLVVVYVLHARLDPDALAALLRHVVGAMLVVVAPVVMLGPLLHRRASRPAQEDVAATVWNRATKVQIVAIGAIVGLAVSITSIGSGSLTLPLLYATSRRLDLRRLVGSDIAFAAVLTPVAALGQLGLGQVDLALCATLLVGSLPGVYIGSKLCGYVPAAWFRPVLAACLVVAGSRMV